MNNKRALYGTCALIVDSECLLLSFCEDGLLVGYLRLAVGLTEGIHLRLRQCLGLHEVFVDEQRSPCVGGGVACLVGCEVGVLPVGELLGFGDFPAEADGENLLQAHVEDTVLGDDGLQVDTVGGLEVATAPKSRYIVLEGKPYLGYFRVGEEVSQGLRHAYMGETEEVAALFGSDLQEGGGIVHAARETGAGLGIHSDGRLLGEVSDRLFYFLGRIHDNDLSAEGCQREPLDEVFGIMVYVGVLF